MYMNKHGTCTHKYVVVEASNAIFSNLNGKGRRWHLPTFFFVLQNIQIITCSMLLLLKSEAA